MKNITEVDAFVYGHKIGTLIEDEGRIYFQYSNSFKTKSLEISPVKLPLLETRSLYTNGDDEIYKGIAGVFYDSLPDKHGMELMNRYFEQKGILSHEVTMLQRLMFVGDRAIGAIEYRPKEHDSKERTQKIISVQDAYKKMRAIQENKYYGSADELMEILDSASPIGGARPKMMINYNEKENIFIYNSETLKTGFEKYVIKFDEFFDEKRTESKEQTKIEYLYMLMAKNCGIDIPKVKLLKENGATHFLIKRFDRDENDRKLHLSTVSALLHKPVHLTRSVSYEDMFVLVNGLTKSVKDKEEMFKRMVFNILSINNDTHPKNFSFIMNRLGEWSLSPAYDITYSKSLGILRPLATIRGKLKDYNTDDFCYIAEKFDIKRGFVDDVIDKTINVLKNFEQYAKEVGLSEKNIFAIQSDINEMIGEINGSSLSAEQKCGTRRQSMCTLPRLRF